MAFRKRRTSGRGSYSPRRSSRRGTGGTMRGGSRSRSRGRRAVQEVRIVVTTPSDMLPPRPSPAGFARVPRRSMF